MADFKLGRLKFVWKGAWVTATAYVKDDIVSYGGNAFVAEEAFTSNADFYVDLDAGRWTKIAGGTEWKNTWQSSTYYKVDDLVKFGGNVYRCNDGHTSQSSLVDDSAKWDLYAEGFDYKSTWSGSTVYKVNDVVKIGGNVYVCNTAHTSQSTFSPDVAKWDLLVEGTNYRTNFAGSTAYEVGDVVKYGGYLHICTTAHTSSTTLDNTKFTVYLPGQVSAGTWTTSTYYKLGDVVRYGGRSYICKIAHTAGTPTRSSPPLDPINPNNDDQNYWELIVKGFDWKGNWTNTTAYKIDDVVEYATSSYICVQAHNDAQDAGDAVTPGSDANYWQLMSQGDSNAVMTTRGDIAFRDATNITRLGIGPAGSFLTSNGNEPVWGHITPQNDYYVSPQGDDSNDGRTAVTSWKTIKHAAEQTFSLGQCRINVSSGTYEEQCPIRIGRGVVLEGNGLGAVTISPDTSNDNGFSVGVSDDGSTPNANSEVFLVNNGSRIRNFVFRNFSTGSVAVSLDPGTGPNDTSVWITSQSPYVQNCTNFTPGGTGMKVDGALHNGGYKSIVNNDFTQINSDGVGVHVLNDGRTEIVSCFTYYCNIGYLAESGGKIRGIVGNNSYGEYGCVARGYSQSETPKTGKLRLPTAVVKSVQTLSDDVVINSSYADEDANVYVVGYTSPTNAAGDRPAYDPTASYPFVAKYDTGGNLLFQASYEGLYGQFTSAVIIDTQLYLGGQVRQSGTDKGIVYKITSAGDIQWQKIISATSIINAVTTDGTRLFAVGDHDTLGTTLVRVPAGGTGIDFAVALDFNDSSINTMVPTAIAYAGDPTTSTDTYAASGDADAQNKLFIALNDSTNNATYIARVSPATGNVESSKYYGQNLGIHGLNIDTGNGDGIYMVASGFFRDIGFTFPATTLTYGAGINATYVSASSSGSVMALATAGGALNQQPDVIRDRKVRGVSSGETADVVSYDGVNGSNIEITVANASGSFLNGEAIELYQSSVQMPFVMRLNMAGDVQWQHSLRNVDGGEYLSSYALGDVVYAVGYMVDDINTDIRRSGLISRYTSNGTLDWQKRVHNASNFTEFNGVSVDGVNVVATGYTGSNDSVYVNVDRDGTSLGTITGDFTFVNAGGTENTSTMASKVIEGIYGQNVTLTLTDFTNTLNSSPGYTNTVGATRNGFSGIGRGITFGIDELSGQPKQGSVLQIAGDDQTYFVLEVVDYLVGDSTDDASATISIDPPIVATKVPSDQTSVTFREAFSQVRMSGHDFLDIGTGGFADTNYPVIIAEDYTQAPDQTRETLSENGGRVFYVSTDQDGNFRVGDYFKIEQATGRATLSTEEFDLTGLNELQLGSVRAGKKGATVDEFSTDGTMADNSDTAVPTEKAVVTYVTDQLNSGAASAYLLKDADVDTTVNVDIATDGSANSITFATAGTTRLTISNVGQIIAETGYTPSTDYALSTKKYIDDALGGLSQNSISENDTNVTVSDSGTGSVVTSVDGTTRLTVSGSGITANGVNFVGDLTGNASGSSSSCTGNAATATKLDITWQTVSSGTLVANGYYFADASSSAITLNLPATPSVGDQVVVADVANVAGTNNITLARGSNKVMNTTTDFVIDMNGGYATLVYSGATYGWTLIG